MLSNQTDYSIRCLVRFAIVVPILAALSGCGEKGITYAPVSGRVSLDGNSLSDAVVQLYYLSEISTESSSARVPVASGKSDTQGQFELQTLTPDRRTVNGAAVGKHRVSITSQIIEHDDFAGDRILRNELVPARFNENSELTFEVPSGGTDECNFDLTTQ